MARFASLIKGGYYRLSDANTMAVASLVKAAGYDSYGSNYYTLRPYTLLDPFCGEGLALAELAQAWNAEAYGVELHPGRNEAARERVGKERVLHGPAEGLRSSGFDIVYANPPYDNLVEVDLTLLAATHLLPEGLLITALPEKATARVLEALSGDFEVLFARWAPDSEWKQVVAVLRKLKVDDYGYHYQSSKWEPAPFEAWAEPDSCFAPLSSSRYRPPGDETPPVETFRMRRITRLLEIADAVAESVDASLLVAEARKNEAKRILNQ